VPITVVSSAPEALYQRAVPGGVRFRRLECDVGLAQRDALTIDEEETGRRCEAFAASWDARVADEAARLRASGVRVVLGDIPPLAFAAAARAAVPSVALANFSWDWIYRHLARRQPALHAAADAAAAAYREAGLLLELPFAGDLAAFPRRERIPLVARRPRLSRLQARAALDEPAPGQQLVLLSFGGLGLPGLQPAVFGRLPAYRFLTVGEWPLLPQNGRAIPAVELDRSGLGYAELVAAADVVVTKPGYGIVSDAIAAGTRIVYTERGDFPEYPILVREMSALLPCAHVGNAELLAGRLEAALDDVLARPLPPPPRLDGAEVAAARLLERWGR